MRNEIRGAVLVAAASVALLAMAGVSAGSDGARATMQLTDEPGNFFKNESTGTSVAVVPQGGRVDFKMNYSDTKHTLTLLSKPPASRLAVDDDSATSVSESVEFDAPGVYLFTCKVHPYMQGVVAVTNGQGSIPRVPKEQLPFIGHLGLDSLEASTVLSVLTNVAASEADKAAKWDVFAPGSQLLPPTPGVGEVWVDTQFERVPGQQSGDGSPKPGSITVVDAATWTVEREVNGLDPEARGRWNNPHNMWTDARLRTVYNTNWFGKWVNAIDRVSGDVRQTISVGEAPTHLVSNPNERSSQFGVLTTPLSGDNDIVYTEDEGGLSQIYSRTTGSGKTHPHGHWHTSDGTKAVVPNVFKGIGFAGSISIMDLETGRVLKEIGYQPEGLAKALELPIAAGVKASEKAYVSSLGSGQVSVIDLDTLRIVKNIPVTFTPDGKRGAQYGVFDTLQVPIQPPVSPDGRFVGVAVMGLTTVDRPPTGAADHVAIIDTSTDEVVRFIPTPAGTHGAHWGAKRGGGYYLYVTNQHANALTVIDPDPDPNGDATDARVVGRIVLANASSGAGVTDGMGGQGLKPLPNVYDGWIQDTVTYGQAGALDAEAAGWIAALTHEQQYPDHARFGH